MPRTHWSPGIMMRMRRAEAGRVCAVAEATSSEGSGWPGREGSQKRKRGCRPHGHQHQRELPQRWPHTGSPAVDTVTPGSQAGPPEVRRHMGKGGSQKLRHPQNQQWCGRASLHKRPLLYPFSDCFFKHEKGTGSWVWWHTPVTPALRSSSCSGDQHPLCARAVLWGVSGLHP